MKPRCISANGEGVALRLLLKDILENGSRVGSYQELRTVLLSVDWKLEQFEAFEAFRSEFLTITGEAGRVGFDRAVRVYTNEKDRRSKPSYLKRLIAFPDRSKRAPEQNSINQLSTIARDLAAKPGYSTLAFTILRPADLVDKFRPGSVPCPIAGDFKFRDGALDLNVMFRTCDALSVGYADLLHLRYLQLQVLEDGRAQTADRRLLEGVPGRLNLFFSRVYVPRSFKLKSGKRANGVDLAHALIETLDRAFDTSAG